MNTLEDVDHFTLSGYRSGEIKPQPLCSDLLYCSPHESIHVWCATEPPWMSLFITLSWQWPSLWSTPALSQYTSVKKKKKKRPQQEKFRYQSNFAQSKYSWVSIDMFWTTKKAVMTPHGWQNIDGYWCQCLEMLHNISLSVIASQ